jgi:hypothetical protein
MSPAQPKNSTLKNNMADYSELMNLEKKKKEPASPVPAPEGKLSPEKTEQSNKQPTQRLINQSTEQSIHQSTRRSINPLMSYSSGSAGNRVMDKPRGFYITEQLNQRIDEAVRYYQEKHHLKKVDRSIVVTTLLDNEANWTEETLDLLLDKIIRHLTNRLTNR